MFPHRYYGETQGDLYAAIYDLAMSDDFSNKIRPASPDVKAEELARRGRLVGSLHLLLEYIDKLSHEK